MEWHNNESPCLHSLTSLWLSYSLHYGPYYHSPNTTSYKTCPVAERQPFVCKKKKKETQMIHLQPQNYYVLKHIHPFASWA